MVELEPDLQMSPSLPNCTGWPEWLRGSNPMVGAVLACSAGGQDSQMEVSIHSRAPGEFGTPQDAALVAASTARLRYVNDRKPGIVRERTDKGFVYRDRAGAAIVDSDELARIKTIAVP